MSTRTNLMRVNHRYEPAIVREREFDAEKVALTRARINAGSFDGCDAIDNVTTDRVIVELKPKPQRAVLAVIGQGTSERVITDDEDSGAMVGFVAGVIALAIVGGVLALAFGL